ncbi:MAG: NAD(P)-dependent oxidoreductase [Candidatus Aureabacteria bacterium]|nr:NAD(P)-dependent oxidoreductase [Candidatus Auribacterota bacterium]
MKILVIGGLGTVGTPLVEELRTRRHEVWVADRYLNHGLGGRYYFRCDIGYCRQVEELFEKQSFDYVYHLAAEFGRRYGEDFYESLWHSNAIGTKNVLRAQEKHRFRMIFTSSSEVYGDYQGLMTEDVWGKVAIRQLNDYAITKHVNELQILNTADRAGVETVRVRLFNTYGPGEYYSEYRSAVCQFIYRALHDLPITVYLNHHRQSSYVAETVRTMANIVEQFKPGEAYNICSDQYHDIKTLSDIVLAYLKKDDSLVEYVKIEEHNTRDKKGDNRKAKRDLGHVCTIPLEKGIPLTIEWQKKVYGKK